MDIKRFNGRSGRNKKKDGYQYAKLFATLATVFVLVAMAIDGVFKTLPGCGFGTLILAITWITIYLLCTPDRVLER